MKLKSKKLLSLILVVSLVFTMLPFGIIATEAADPVADQYIVTGDPDFIGGWDGTNVANLMTANGNGTYSKEYTVDHAYSSASLKVVKNEADWIGDQTGNNVVFDLTEAGTFTVVYHPDAAYNDGLGYVTVEGDIVHIEVGMTVNSVYAAGNGEGAWLNGQSWNPSASGNEMTEIADDVWQISFNNVPYGFERQIKFAVNGAWTHTFGAPDFEDGEDMNDHIGEWMDAKYNSSNITFDTDDICNITATLDLRNFDYTTKQGALYKIDVEYTECLVAGTPAEIFGTVWDPTNDDNLMEFDEVTGTWSIDYTVDSAYNVVQLKTVKNGAEWIGDDTDEYVTFALTGPGTFTVTYDPDETFNGGKGVTTVSGAIVEPIVGFNYNTVFAVGNGEGTYLNGKSWEPGAAANEMTEIADDVWQISFNNVPDGLERQIKFAIDGAWTYNFGFNDLIGQDFAPGVWMPAKYNGENITFDTDDICTITATLDLSNFDFTTKQGALYKIDIDYGDEPVEPFTYSKVYAAGNGEGAWLNGASWDPTYAANEMTEISDGVYQISFANVPDGFDRQIKFLTDGAWTHNFGAPDFEAGYDMNHHIGEWMDAKYDSHQNITFNTNDICTITATIDLSNFDFTTKQGAKYKIDIDYGSEPVDPVDPFSYSNVFVAGNGFGNWLNGIWWDNYNSANQLTQVSENIWEIEFNDVTSDETHSFNFFLDNGYSFGGNFEAFNTMSNATLNSENICFDTVADLQDVKIRLDLSSFDFSAQTGAKFSVTVLNEKYVPGFSITSSKVKQGNSVTLDLSIDNNSGITAFKLYIEYPEDVLTLSEVTYSDLFEDPVSGKNQLTNPYNVLWFSTTSSDETCNGVFAHLTFTANEYALGDYGIHIYYAPDDVFDSNFNNVYFKTTDGTVTVLDYTSGDINKDDEINMKDIVLLRQYLNDWDVEIDFGAADVNRDGSINMKDIVLLQQYLNDWDVELK